MSILASLMAASLVATSSSGHGETITYHHEPGGLCLPENTGEGCTDYTIVLAPDGRGSFEQQRVAQGVPTGFAASPAQMAAFARKLRPYRAHGEVRLTGGSLCRSFVTEGETIDIRWQVAGKAVDHLVFNAGCQFPESAKMFAALLAAPRLLPIADRLPRR